MVVTAAAGRSKIMGSKPPWWRPELTRSTFWVANRPCELVLHSHTEHILGSKLPV